MFVEPIVSTQWLAEALAKSVPDQRLRILDCTFIIPPTTRNARQEYEKEHIPGAVFFDIDGIADHATTLPHMLPSANEFAKAVGGMGITNDNWLVCYDNFSMAGAARAWWMFRVFGHEQVAILDGGLPKWKSEQRAVTAIPTPITPRSFITKTNARLVRSRVQIEANLASGEEQVIDARSAGRFQGTEPEPRPGLRSGHIDGSINVPFSTLLQATDKTLLPAAQIHSVFANAGVEARRPIITSCGSGVSACMLALALHHIGRRDVAVYDGSWAEWGALSVTDR